MKHELASEGGASVYVHGGSDKKLVARVMSGGGNVLAISGPAGSGKTDTITQLAKRTNSLIVNRLSVRDPRESERTGLVPYSKIEYSDIARCEKPCICSVNVEITSQSIERWKRAATDLDLGAKGIVAPEFEKAITYIREFTNVYIIQTVVEQQCLAASQGKMLLLEINPQLERIWAQFFPQMRVVRLFTDRIERVRRLMERHKPKSEHEWTIASIKILNSVTTRNNFERYTRDSYLVDNNNRDDAENNLENILGGRLFETRKHIHRSRRCLSLLTR